MIIHTMITSTGQEVHIEEQADLSVLLACDGNVVQLSDVELRWLAAITSAIVLTKGLEVTH